MKEFFKLMRSKRFRKTMRMMLKMMFQVLALSKQKRFLSENRYQEKQSRMFQSQARLYTRTAVNLGGLIIKMGQFVSSRIDLLPKEFTDELSTLQDSVQPVDSEKIFTRLKQELGSKLDTAFTTIDTNPLAAASLGQVHIGTLSTGEKVAVKVQRPGIDQIIHIDLKSLKIAIQMMKRFTKIKDMVDLDSLYDEFHTVLSDELDYLKEGQYAEQVQLNFIENPTINIPQIYWDYSTSRVLTMEYMDGVKINEFETIEKYGVDRKALAKNLYEIYLQQLLVDGVIHADPHPGNLFAQKDGSLALIDFGMVAHLDERSRELMIQVLVAIFMKDTESAVKGLTELGYLKKNADVTFLTKNLGEFFGQLLGEKADLSFLERDNTAAEFREFIYSNPFQFPSKMIFIAKTIQTIFGIVKGLDPEFDFIKNSKPYIEEVLTGDLKKDTLKVVWEQAKSAFVSIIPTTKKILSVVNKMDAGELRVGLNSSLENRLFDAQTTSTKRIVHTIVGACFFLSSIVLYVSHFETPSYVLGGIGLFVMLIQMMKSSSSSSSNSSKRRPRSRAMKSMSNSGFKRPKWHP